LDIEKCVLVFVRERERGCDYGVRYGPSTSQRCVDNIECREERAPTSHPWWRSPTAMEVQEEEEEWPVAATTLGEDEGPISTGSGSSVGWRRGVNQETAAAMQTFVACLNHPELIVACQHNQEETLVATLRARATTTVC
jgi:hypothetical protein